ncbi:MAG: replication factor C small subunit [Promethearchaeota archaeon]
MMKSQNQQPWVEKYRPRHLKDVVGQTEIVNRLKIFTGPSGRSMPHLMFAGPAGTGKTTCAIALIRDLFGPKMKRNSTYLELNASDARGIGVIRTDVKDFAKTQPPVGVPFKILVLDEADSTTADAQQALRRTMEKFTQNCRFILICNYSNKIILPIQSRTSLFRFSPLSESEIIERIKFVAEKENVDIEDDGIRALIYVVNGDMRRAVNYLQAAASLGEKIDEELIYRITGKINPQEIHHLLEAALAKEFMVAKRKLDTLFKQYGLSGRNIIKQCHQEVFNLEISERAKLDILKLLAEIEFRLSQGATEEIQLNSMLAKLAIIDL